MENGGFVMTKWQMISVAALASLAAIPAEAAQFDFQFGDYSWSIDSDDAPYQNDTDGLVYAGIASLRSGTTGPTFDIDFFSDSKNGGLRLTDADSGDISAFSGATLYSIVGSTIGFNTGNFDLTPVSGGTPSRLTISTAAAVPEPATWAMMIVGFGMAGAALRSRRRAAPQAQHA